MAELSLEKAIELTKLLERHTYGQEGKKMDNDPRWITDKTPNESGWYIATVKYEGSKPDVVMLEFRKNGDWSLHLGDVLAWMPMPPVYIPPKAEEPEEKKCMNCNNFGPCFQIEKKDGNRTFVSSNDPDFSCGFWKPKE